jgi:catechol 2,3-dioxygenase-like lactoylglutathione lyase family enzyme
METSNAVLIMAILSIDHVQIAMPPGQEDQARAFYVGVLGFTELLKPAELDRAGLEKLFFNPSFFAS